MLAKSILDRRHCRGHRSSSSGKRGAAGEGIEHILGRRLLLLLLLHHWLGRNLHHLLGLWHRRRWCLRGCLKQIPLLLLLLLLGRNKTRRRRWRLHNWLLHRRLHISLHRRLHRRLRYRRRCRHRRPEGVEGIHRLLLLLLLLLRRWLLLGLRLPLARRRLLVLHLHVGIRAHYLCAENMRSNNMRSSRKQETRGGDVRGSLVAGGNAMGNAMGLGGLGSWIRHVARGT